MADFEVGWEELAKEKPYIFLGSRQFFIVLIQKGVLRVMDVQRKVAGRIVSEFTQKKGV